MVYSDFQFKLNRIIIEDVAYGWLPDNFIITIPEAMNQSSTSKTFNNERVVITQDPDSGIVWNTSGSNLFKEVRKSINNILQIDWSGQAFMSMCMKDHLQTLYSTQKRFWIQYDDEMSYSLAPMTIESTGSKYYITPTFPIGFCRYNTGANNEFTNEFHYIDIYVNGNRLEWESNPWRLNTDLGVVRFENEFNTTDVVTMRYVWRAYGRIAKINLNAADIAQNTYTGSILFEQLPSPIEVDRWDRSYTAEDCISCDDDDNDVSSEDLVPLCKEYQGFTGDAIDATRPGGTVAWSSLGNGKLTDGVYIASSALAPDTKTNILRFTGVLPEHKLKPNVDVIKYIRVKVVEKIVPNTVTVSDVVDDLVTLTRNSVPIGDNAAWLSYLDINDQTRVYEFTDLTGITIDDINSGLLGVDLGFSRSSGSATNPSVYIDVVQVQVCYEGIRGDNPQGIQCTEPISIVKESSTYTELQTNKCVTQVSGCTFNLTGFDIPENHHILGYEITKLVVENDGPCSDTRTDASITTNWKVGGSVYNTTISKSAQKHNTRDHAYEGSISTDTNVYQFGGMCNFWGSGFGAYTPKNINDNGIVISTNFSSIGNGCGSFDYSKWQVDANYNFTKTRTTSLGGTSVSSSTDSTNSWTPAGVPDNSSTASSLFSSIGTNDAANLDTQPAIPGEGVLTAASYEGSVSFRFKWVGTGLPPKYIIAAVKLGAMAYSIGLDPAALSATANNGLQDVSKEYINVDNTTTPGTPIYQKKTISQGYRFKVLYVDDNGEATWTVSGVGCKSSGSYSCYAAVRWDLTVASCSTGTEPDVDSEYFSAPQIAEVGMRVYHAPACFTKELYHSNSTPTSWGPGSGVNGESTFSSTTSGLLVMSGYNFSTYDLFKSTAKIVGYKVQFDARRTKANTDSPESGNLTIRVTNTSSSNFKSFLLPATTSWQSYVLGGEKDMWGFSTPIFSGNQVPSKTGADINTHFSTILGLSSNPNSEVFEFKNLRVTIYYVDVC